MTAAGEFLRVRQPRRRRRRAPVLRLFGTAARVALVVLPPLAAASWMLRTQRFALQSVHVLDTARVPESWVRERLRPELGTNLLLVSLSRVEGRLAGHPWIARVAVDKELPHGLRVAVEERRPAAVLETEEGLVFVDESGRRIAPVGESETVDGWVRLAGGPDGAMISPALALEETRCLRRAIELSRRLADARAVGPGAGVTRIEVVGDDDFRVFIESLPFPVVVRSGDGVARAQALGTLLPRIVERAGEIGELDLRFEGRVIVRPASGNWQQVKES